jgi:hypothetical protein
MQFIPLQGQLPATGTMAPAVYCFLPDKATDSYVKALQEVAKLDENIFSEGFPETVLCDFELSIWRAFANVAPTAKISGCQVSAFKNIFCTPHPFQSTLRCNKPKFTLPSVSTAGPLQTSTGPTAGKEGIGQATQALRGVRPRCPTHQGHQLRAQGRGVKGIRGSCRPHRQTCRGLCKGGPELRPKGGQLPGLPGDLLHRCLQQPQHPASLPSSNLDQA